MKPYVQRGTYLSPEQMDMLPFGKIPQGGLTGQHYLNCVHPRIENSELGSAREATVADAASLAIAS